MWNLTKMLTLFVCIGALAILVYRRRFSLDSIKSLFYITWFYYAFSVPIDLLLGIEVYTGGRLDRRLDLNLVTARPYITMVVVYYLLCAICFWVAYNIPPLPKRDISYKRYRVSLPSVWLVLLISGIMGLLYMSRAGAFSRQTRSLLLDQDISFKILSVMLLLARALDLIFIVVSDDRRQATVVMIAGTLLGVIVGDRTWALFFPLVLLMRYNVKINRRQLIGIAFVGFLLVVSWKTIYARALAFFTTGTPFYFPESLPYLSLSRIDATSSFRIFATFLKMGNSPYWLGSTYVKIPLAITWPRFLTDDPVLTLSEQYIWSFVPDAAARGAGMGFSALAESWLNFGFLGPILLGLTWGLLARFVDHKRRGLSFFVMAIMTIRLFRSDFASLYKNWVVLLGGSLILLMLLLRCVALLHRIAARPKSSCDMQRNCDRPADLRRVVTST